MEEKKLIKACIFRGLSAVISLLTDTYANSLFLASYPRNYLPYFYIGMAVFAFAAMQLSQSFLKRDLNRFIRISHVVIAAFIGFFLLLPMGNYYWMPFIVAVFIASCAVMISASNFVVVINYFGLREYKKVQRWLSLASMLSFMAMGFLTFVILKFFSINFLLILTFVFFIILILMYFLERFPSEIVEVRKRHKVTTVNLHKNPLFIFSGISIFLMTAAIIFVDYALKSELIRNHFTAAEMGQFLGVMNAASVLMVVGSMPLTLPYVLKRFGVTGLVLIPAIGTALLGVLFFISPTLWVLTAVSLLGSLLRVGFFSQGNQILMNVYAPAIRNIAQYQTQSLGRLAFGFSAVVLIALTYLGDMRLLAACVIFLGISLYLIGRKLGREYAVELKAAINMHRFDSLYLETEGADKEMTLKVAVQAFSKNTEEDQLFALGLLRKTEMKTVPPFLIQALNSPFFSVQRRSLDIIRQVGDPSITTTLMERLASEKEPELIWALVEALVGISPAYVLLFAQSAISSTNPAIRASAIYAFLKGGTPEQKTLAENAFTEMHKSVDEKDRFWAAQIINTNGMPNAEASIIQLISDPSAMVARHALHAAQFYPNEKMVAFLIAKLPDPQWSLFVGQALVAMGVSIVPFLLTYAKELTQSRQVNLILIALSKIPGNEAEAALLKLLSLTSTSALPFGAISLSYRAKEFSLSDKGRGYVDQEIKREIERIRLFQASLTHYSDPAVKTEIISQCFAVKKRYLYLLAAAGDAKTILQIIPTFLREKEEGRAFDSAIELLELSIPNPEIRETAVQIVGKETQKAKENFNIAELDDPWILRVIEFTQGIKRGDKMDDLIEKILVLRKVPLFSNLSAELLQSIAEIVQQEDIAAGETIFKQDEIADGVYIVVKGGVEIIKNQQVINYCESGGFFGELALLDDAPRFASAIAKVDSQLFYIEKSDFNRLTDEVPEILRALTQTIISYLRKAQVV